MVKWASCVNLALFSHLSSLLSGIFQVRFDRKGIKFVGILTFVIEHRKFVDFNSFFFFFFFLMLTEKW